MEHTLAQLRQLDIAARRIDADRALLALHSQALSTSSAIGRAFGSKDAGRALEQFSNRLKESTQ